MIAFVFFALCFTLVRIIYGQEGSNHENVVSNPPPSEPAVIPLVSLNQWVLAVASVSVIDHEQSDHQSIKEPNCFLIIATLKGLDLGNAENEPSGNSTFCLAPSTLRSSPHPLSTLHQVVIPIQPSSEKEGFARFLLNAVVTFSVISLSPVVSFSGSGSCSAAVPLHGGLIARSPDLQCILQPSHKHGLLGLILRLISGGERASVNDVHVYYMPIVSRPVVLLCIVGQALAFLALGAALSRSQKRDLGAPFMQRTVPTAASGGKIESTDRAAAAAVRESEHWSEHGPAPNPSLLVGASDMIHAPMRFRETPADQPGEEEDQAAFEARDGHQGQMMHHAYVGQAAADSFGLGVAFASGDVASMGPTGERGQGAWTRDANGRLMKRPLFE